MDDKEKTKLKTDVKEEACLIDLEQYADDIERIAEQGPTSLRDIAIIRKCLYFTSGKLDHRRALRKEMEDQLPDEESL